MCWKFSGDLFWVLKHFCSSETDLVTIFLALILGKLDLFGKMIFLDNWFWPTDVFTNSFRFRQLIFDNSLCYQTHFFTNWFFYNWFFLTINFLDSLSSYLTDQLRVWDSRPLVLFWKKKNFYPNLVRPQLNQSLLGLAQLSSACNNYNNNIN